MEHQEAEDEGRMPSGYPGFPGFLRWASGSKEAAVGEVWFCGISGAMPIDGCAKVQRFFGGVMSFRRELAFGLFDDLLFDLFLNRMAMGEDKYLSMGALRSGDLWYDPGVCFLHPPTVSTYREKDQSRFHAKVFLSRRWLSNRYATVFSRNRFLATLHFYWYSLVRLLGATLVFLRSPSPRTRGLVVGVGRGILLSRQIGSSTASYRTGLDWFSIAEKEVVVDRP